MKHPAGSPPVAPARRDGSDGWDEYAPFYDWENARTLGRRDVPFWRQVARASRGRVLELGCGTGRVSRALIDAGVDFVGIDRSAEMLHRFRRARGRIVRGDIRQLPFARGSFSTVIAPYGLVQSLLSDRDLKATLDAVGRVLARGGTFGVDLVPDVPNWQEYANRIQHRGKGPRGAHFTLIESVRQDRSRRLTTFEQRYVVRRGGRVAHHRFDLTFRTLTMRQMSKRLEKAGFRVETVLGDYRGGPWDARADVWIILAKKM